MVREKYINNTRSTGQVTRIKWKHIQTHCGNKGHLFTSTFSRPVLSMGSFLVREWSVQWLYRSIKWSYRQSQDQYDGYLNPIMKSLKCSSTWTRPRRIVVHFHIYSVGFTRAKGPCWSLPRWTHKSKVREIESTRLITQLIVFILPLKMTAVVLRIFPLSRPSCYVCRLVLARSSIVDCMKPMTNVETLRQLFHCNLVSNCFFFFFLSLQPECITMKYYNT